jgi:hypothetical protein
VSVDAAEPREASSLAFMRGADGGVEAGLGVAQGVGAGVFEGAVEIAQGSIHLPVHSE